MRVGELHPPQQLQGAQGGPFPLLLQLLLQGKDGGEGLIMGGGEVVKVCWDGKEQGGRQLGGVGGGGGGGFQRCSGYIGLQ
jgi:hypothetical protein